MASASSFLSEDQFLCSICLEVFTEPVSIPCGHNFCKACITKNWEGKNQCQCPLCNEKFNKGLKLRVNTGFREVVENFKKLRFISKNDVPAKPGQVPCDCCTGNKFKAFKTCLVCLASYCETHLEPHLRVAALKRHKLTEPVHNLENNVCKNHNRILELFCRNDLTRVCVLCTEHRAHDTVPLQEEYEEKKFQLEQKKVEVQEMIQERQKKIQTIKEVADTKGEDKNEAIANSLQDSKQVRTAHIWWPNGIPQKFNRYAYILGKKGFSEGRFYYEVQVAMKTGWDLGVVRESIHGKRTFTQNPRNGAWIIKLRNNTKCTALNNTSVNLSLRTIPERVGVFVDYEKGLVSFYDVDTVTLIYSFTGCMFNEKIYPFFSPGPSEDGINGAPLVLSSAKCSATSEESNGFLGLIITLIALFFLCIN
uniref:E3 ubiquitin-protein ligase TRIM39-like n=1 Tax=Lates calcarifer TaxID=8187 RepID=A0A4W6BW20_LATCA